MLNQKTKKYYFNYLKMCSYIIFIFLIDCTDSHNTEIEKDLYYINIEKVIDNKQGIKLSEIATRITYVPLETQTENLIGATKMLRLTESFIFVCGKDKIQQYASDGKFIRQIGRNGRGPGEYKNIMYFAVNEKAKEVLISDEFRNYKYDINGDFIENVQLPSTKYLYYRPTRIAFYLINYVGKQDNLVVTNERLIPLFRFENKNARPETNLKFGGFPLYAFKHNLYFKENYNDTVFCVKDSLLIPHLIYNEKNLLIDKGFDLQPTGNVSDLIQQLERIKNKLMTDGIIESNRFVFTSYITGLDPRNTYYTRFLFDKKFNMTYSLDKEKFVNDIDNGCNLWPAGILQDTILYSYLTPFELKTHIASEVFRSSTPKYSKSKKALEKLANSLDENDNPVLMLVKLKE